MLINEHTAVSTTKLLLVPYSKHHVLQYHEWMQDPSVQEATASEPLTLTQEYAMQESWRKDADKLTSIICKPLPSADSQTLPDEIKPETYDTAERMIGDVNLFLSLSHTGPNTNTENVSTSKPASTFSDIPSPASRPVKPNLSTPSVTGELEVMIPRPTSRRQGHGRAALRTFLHYILMHESEILAEFLNSHSKHPTSPSSPQPATGTGGTVHLSAKIASTNLASLSLFEGLGFEKIYEEPNYFGEFELGLPRVSLGRMGTGIGIGVDVDGYKEVVYR